MSLEKVIVALEDGPKTATEISVLMRMPKHQVLSAARKLTFKGAISNDLSKYSESKEYWLAKYTLVDASKIDVVIHNYKKKFKRIFK